jgi:hypothetical protein
MKPPASFSIEKMNDRLVYWHSKDLRVEVLLCPDSKLLKPYWAHGHPWGNFVVSVYVGDTLLSDERVVKVKLPAPVHEYNTTWDFVSQRALTLAHDAAERTYKNLWGVMLR